MSLKKSLLLLIPFIAASSALFCQTYPNNTNQASDNNRTRIKGGTESYFIFKRFEDTTAANLQPYIKGTPNLVIKAGEEVYHRSADTSRWVLLSNGITVAGPNGIDSITRTQCDLNIWQAGNVTTFTWCDFLIRYRLNSDSTYYIPVRYSGDGIDSVWLPHTNLYARGIIRLKDTTDGTGFPAKVLYDVGEPGGNASSSELLQPGYVTHDTLYTYDVTSAIYRIGTKVYTSASGSITLDAADGTFDRIDVIALDTFQNIIKVTGTPSANPQIPQVDPGSQIGLTTIIVKTGTTAPDNITRVIAYDENVEWSHTATLTPNFNYTGNPYHLLKSIDVAAWTTSPTSAFTFTSPVKLNISSFNVLKFFIDLKATLPTNAYIFIALLNGTTYVTPYTEITTTFGLNRTSTDYQNISVPFSSLSITGTQFDRVQFYLYGPGPGMNLDYVQFQGGISNGSSPYITDIYRSPGTTNVYKVINGISSLAFTDSTGGSTLTASNGTRIRANNIELGGEPLSMDDSIMTSGHTLFVTGTSTFGHPLINVLDSGTGTAFNAEGGIFAIHGKTTDGAGVWGEATGTGNGLFGTANTGYGVSGTSVSNAGIRGYSTGASGAGRFELQRTSTNTVEPVLQIRRTTTGSPLDGIGSSIDYYGQRLFGAPTIANQLVSRWTDITNVTSEFDITGMNNVNPEVFARFQPGSIVIVGDGADTLATKAYARSLIGGGTGNTIYTADDVLTGDRTVGLDGHILRFQDVVGGNIAQIGVTPGAEVSTIASTDYTGSGNFGYLENFTTTELGQNTIGTGFNGGVKNTTILSKSNVDSAKIDYTADLHSFIGQIIYDTPPTGDAGADVLISWNPTTKILQQVPMITGDAGYVLNIMDYGGVADGVTDNLAALKAVRDSAVSLKAAVIFFPAGNYYLSDSVIFTKSIRIEGVNSTQGMIDSAHTVTTNYYGFSQYSSRIKLAANKSGFVIRRNSADSTNPVVGISNLDFTSNGVYTSSTRGAFIKILDNVQNTTIRNNSFRGAHYQVDNSSGFYTRIENNVFLEPDSVALHISNTGRTDTWDGWVVNNLFLPGFTITPKIALFWQSGGGIKLYGNKFDGSFAIIGGADADSAAAYQYDIYAKSVAPTSDFLISGNSFENYSREGIKLDFTAFQVGNIQINNNQFAPIKASGAAVEVINGWLVEVDNFNIQNYNTVLPVGIKLTNCNGVHPGTGTITNYTATFDLTGSTNISYDINGQTAVGVAPNIYGFSIVNNLLQMQPASGSFPGVVSVTTQTFAGTKTFSTSNNNTDGIFVTNTSSGNAARTAVKLTNNAGQSAQLAIHGSGTSDANHTYFESDKNFTIGLDYNVASGGTSKFQIYTSGYNNAAAPYFTFDANGRIGIGPTSPTALLNIKAGTATANTAPLKFTAGTVLTTPESGVMETKSGNELMYSTSTTAASRGFVGVQRYVAKTTTYTATTDDFTIDCTSGTFVVTLPTAVGIQGRVYIVKNSGAGTITMAGASAQTFDGVTSPTIAAGAVAQYQSNNANWIKIN